MIALALSKVLDRLHGGLAYHVGPVVVNQLGIQVFRAAYKNVSWRLRAPHTVEQTKSFVDLLDSDGCISIPDFLPPAVFETAREEHERGLRNLQYSPHISEDNGVETELLNVQEHRDAYPALWTGLVENQLLNAIISGALRRPICADPTLSLLHARKRDAGTSYGPGHIVGANYPHADVHFPTFKAFLYMRDVDETNGAFQFAPGSHRMTLARIAYEYDASIRVARARRDGSWGDKNYAVVRQPSPAQERLLGGLRFVPFCGRANTLVIANTQGFHRMGEFEPGTSRHVAFLCYRSSEPGSRPSGVVPKKAPAKSTITRPSSRLD